MESGKSKIRGTGQQAGDAGGDGQIKSESCLLGNWSFVLFKLQLIR